jgi:hypothetical protein
MQGSTEDDMQDWPEKVSQLSLPIDAQSSQSRSALQENSSCDGNDGETSAVDDAIPCLDGNGRPDDDTTSAQIDDEDDKAQVS